MAEDGRSRDRWWKSAEEEAPGESGVSDDNNEINTVLVHQDL